MSCMQGSISVDSVTIDDFLGKKDKIIIPDYQRRYDWKERHVEKLVRDLYTNYEGFLNKSNQINDDDDGIPEYFIGNLVFYNNKENKNSIEVVDGQQRITTLFILFISLIHKVNKIKTTNKDLENQKEIAVKKLSKYMWEYNERTEQIYYERPILTTNVIGDDQVELDKVMDVGEVTSGGKSNYIDNYKTVSKLLDELFIDEYLDKEDCLRALVDFIYAIYSKTILLTINTSTEDMALTIFQTLNDSGMQLSPADILKAKLYRVLKDTQRSKFVADWNSYLKRIDKINKTIKLSINDVHEIFNKHVQAEEGYVDTNSTQIKKYFDRNPEELLKRFYLDGYIESVLKVYEDITNNYDDDTKNVSEFIKLLHVILRSPYSEAGVTAVIYIITHGGEKYFNGKAPKFLRNLIYVVFVKGFMGATTAIVKSACLDINMTVVDSTDGNVYMGLKGDSHINHQVIEHNIKYEVRSTKSLLYKHQVNALELLAYNDLGQRKLLPEEVHVEHILPKKWERNYIPSLQNRSINKDKVNEYKNCMANLTLFESKLNIAASNNYFKEKKGYYKSSSIAITKELSKHTSDEWYIEDIDKRRYKLYNDLMAILTIYSI